MLITLEHFDTQYGRIKQQAAAAGGGCSVLILVAPDCDALCAARILTNLFKTDGVEFKMVAVAGYTDVQNEVNQAMTPSEIGGANPLRSVILINCGAVPKIDALLDLPEGEASKDLTLYILDSHRPIYHTNIKESKETSGRIRMLVPQEKAQFFAPTEEGGSGLAEDIIPDPGDSDAVDEEDPDDLDEDEEDEEDKSDEQDEDDEDDDDEDEDGEDEDGEGEGGDKPDGSAKKRKRQEKKKRRLRKAAERSDDEDDEEGGRKRKRRRKDDDGSDDDSDDDDDDGEQKLQDMYRRMTKVKADRYRKYYSQGNHYGFPASYTALMLASRSLEAGVVRNDMLWLAIVGMTDVSCWNNSCSSYCLLASFSALLVSPLFLFHLPSFPFLSLPSPFLSSFLSLQLFLNEQIDVYVYGSVYRALKAMVAELNGEARNPFALSAANAGGVVSGAGNSTGANVLDQLASSASRLDGSGGGGYYGAAGAGIGAGAVAGQDTSGKASVGVRGFIADSLEPRFVAHRFWNLYDAMFYSEYCASKLETWKAESGGTADRSKLKLDGLLALTGVKLEVIRQPWVSLSQEQKDTIMRRLQAFSVCAAIETNAVDEALVGWDCSFLLDPSNPAAISFNEPETARMVLEKFPDLTPSMFYKSFTYTVDMEAEISAADFAAGINGLLTAGHAAPALLEQVKDTLGLDVLNAAQTALAGGAGGAGSSAGGGSAGGAGAGLSSSSNAALAAAAAAGARLAGAPAIGGSAVLTSWEGHSWKDGFLAGWEAISRRSIDYVTRGITAHCTLRKALMRLGNAIVRNRQVSNGKLVRQLVIDTDVMSDYDSRTFTQPIALAALGRYLIKLYRDSLQSWRSVKTGQTIQKPLILFVVYPYTPVGKRWLTVHGLPVTNDWNDPGAVSFLDAFQSAARDAGAEYLMDSFDSATMLLDFDHKGAFMEFLDPST